MSDIERILDGLNKVKKRGGNKWTACCPVHNDRTPSMSIELKDDDTVVMYCFSCGAKGLDVVNALSMPVAWLFPEGSTHERKEGLTKRQERELMDSHMFLHLYREAEKRGDKIAWADRKMLKMHQARYEELSKRKQQFG